MSRCKNTIFFSEIESFFKIDAGNTTQAMINALKAIRLTVKNTHIGDQVQRTDIHLPCGEERWYRLDRQLTDGGPCLGQAVEHLPHLTTDASIYSKDFCHNDFLFCFLMLNFGWLSSRLDLTCAPAGLGLERLGKSTRTEKNEVWICPLSVLFQKMGIEDKITSGRLDYGIIRDKG